MFIISTPNPLPLTFQAKKSGSLSAENSSEYIYISLRTSKHYIETSHWMFWIALHHSYKRRHYLTNGSPYLIQNILWWALISRNINVYGHIKSYFFWGQYPSLLCVRWRCQMQTDIFFNIRKYYFLLPNPQVIQNLCFVLW